MITHLILNDLGYLRRWIFAWCLVLLLVVLKFAALQTPLGWSADYWQVLQRSLSFGFIPQVLLLFLLTGKIIQKEGFYSVRAYWPTRPIPRSQLWLSKCSVLFIVILAPMAVQGFLIGWSILGNPADGWQALRSQFFIALALTLFGIIPASLTKGLGPMMLCSVVFFVSLKMTSVFLHPLFAKLPAQPVIALLEIAGRILFLDIIIMTLAGGSILYVFWRQYQSPAPRWRLALGYGSALAWILFVPWNNALRPVPSTNMDLPSGAEATVTNFAFGWEDHPFGAPSARADVEGHKWHEVPDRGRFALYAEVRWSDLPDDWFSTFRAYRSFGPENRWLGSTREHGPVFHRRKFTRSHAESLFPDDVFAHLSENHSMGRLIFKSSWRELPKLDSKSEFTSIVASRFFRWEKKVINLEQGKADFDNMRIIVTPVAQQQGNLQLHVHFIKTGSFDSDRYRFALRNPETREVFFSQTNLRSISRIGLPFGIGSSPLPFNHSSHHSETATLDGWELYLIRPILIGTDVRPIRYQIRDEWEQ